MKRLFKLLRISLLCIVATVAVAPSGQAQPVQSIDIDQLYHKLSQSKSALVKALPLRGCYFISEDKARIKALIDILKKADIKQVSSNESFFYHNVRISYEGVSSAKFTLDDGTIVILGFDLEYTYEPTVDAMLFLPNQQQVPLSANWTMNRELFHWARKIGTPTVSLDKLRASNEGALETPADDEAYSRKEQQQYIAGCKGKIRSNNYYRDPTIYQTCASGSDDVIFYQRHPDICASGWTPRPKDVE
jgi:hypothetical protein